MNLPSEAELLQELPLDDCAWMLGRMLGFAAIENAQGAHVTKVALAFSDASLLAERLEVPLPPLPSLTRERTKDEGAAIQYLLRRAGGAIADALAAKHGVLHRALFEAALKLQILYLIYQPREEMTLALREAIVRCCEEAQLPEWLWRLLDERIKDGIPKETARQEIQRAEKLIWIHLNAQTPSTPAVPEPAPPVVSAPSPAPTSKPTQSSAPPKKTTPSPPPTPPTPAPAPQAPARPLLRPPELNFSPKLLSWDLGQTLAIAAILHVQRAEESVISSWFQAAYRLARSIDVSLPNLPHRQEDQKTNSRAAFYYLVKSAGMLVAEKLNAKFGLPYEALFDASMKCVILSQVYTPWSSDATDIIKSVRKSLSVGGIPQRLYAELLQKLDSGDPTHTGDDVLYTLMPPIREFLATRNRASIAGNKSATTIEFNRHGTSITVRVRLVSAVTVTVPLTYDTGATFTMVNKPLAQALGLTQEKIARYVDVSTVNGVICAPVFEISSIEVGEAKVEGPIEVVLAENLGNNAPDGLLGLNFLRAFITEVDIALGTITFKAR